MTEFRDRIFSAGETVDTDGNSFLGCTFNGATLRYGGGPHPTFEECRFDAMSWYFTDAALRTIQLLQSLSSSDIANAMVTELFKPGNYIGE
jgi:hypothetical protein